MTEFVEEKLTHDSTTLPVIQLMELSEDELNDIADCAIDIISRLISHFDCGDFSIDEFESDEDELILDINAENSSFLIGRHGRTLDALQTVVSALMTRSLGYKCPVVVDVEGYKNRQREKIESIAFSAAKRSQVQARPIHLRPMSPADRRLVHIALKDNHHVSTASEGYGADRHVVVTYQ